MGAETAVPIAFAAFSAHQQHRSYREQKKAAKAYKADLASQRQLTADQQRKLDADLRKQQARNAIAMSRAARGRRGGSLFSDDTPALSGQSSELLGG